MSGPETREPTAWQHPADSDKDEDDVADHDTNEGADDDGYMDSKDEDGDEDDDKDGEEDDDDEQYKSRIRSVNHKHIARQLARMIEESGHSQNGANAVAAFHRYSLQGETSEIRMIEFSDLQIPPEHLARLLDPISSDARVRAYFRGVSEDINKKAIVPGKGDAYAQTAAHLIFGIMQREIAQSDPRRQHSARVSHTLVAPDLSP
jgi:hypothetical protein